MPDLKPLKTGDVRKALEKVFPYITDDMVRAAADCGDIITEPLNPLAENSHRVYNRESLRQFLERCPQIPIESYRLIVKDLDLEKANPKI